MFLISYISTINYFRISYFNKQILLQILQNNLYIMITLFNFHNKLMKQIKLFKIQFFGILIDFFFIRVYNNDFNSIINTTISFGK